MVEKQTSPERQTSNPNPSQDAFPLWARVLLIVLAVAVAVQIWLITQLAFGDDPQEKPVVAEKSGTEITAAPDEAREEWLGVPYDPSTWDPFYEMQRMRERMDSIFGEAFGRFESSDRFGDLSQTWMPFRPQTDLRDTGDAYELEVDLPGVEESNVEVEVEGQTLHLSGRTEERKQTKDESGQILRRERHVGQFERSFVLPEPVDGEKLVTNIDKGVLRIVIPKAKPGGKEPKEEEKNS